MTRGFAAIGLDNPKCLANMGGVMRAAHCFGAGFVVIGGKRPKRMGSIATDTTKAYRSIPHVIIGDVLDCIPYDTVPVAVDLVSDAVPLHSYRHPERAYYIFGAEDATLGERILSRCRDRVMIPTSYCLNLAATVNVILYDRLAKGMRDENHNPG